MNKGETLGRCPKPRKGDGIPFDPRGICSREGSRRSIERRKYLRRRNFIPLQGSHRKYLRCRCLQTDMQRR